MLADLEEEATRRLLSVSEVVRDRIRFDPRDRVGIQPADLDTPEEDLVTHVPAHPDEFAKVCQHTKTANVAKGKRCLNCGMVKTFNGGWDG